MRGRETITAAKASCLEDEEMKVASTEPDTSKSFRQNPAADTESVLGYDPVALTCNLNEKAYLVGFSMRETFGTSRTSQCCSQSRTIFTDLEENSLQATFSDRVETSDSCL